MKPTPLGMYAHCCQKVMVPSRPRPARPSVHPNVAVGQLHHQVQVRPHGHHLAGGDDCRDGGRVLLLPRPLLLLRRRRWRLMLLLRLLLLCGTGVQQQQRVSSSRPHCAACASRQECEPFRVGDWCFWVCKVGCRFWSCFPHDW